jgi:protein SCO1/2
MELAQIKTALGPLGGCLQVLFVTVDPQRDTAPLLKAYMENFDPSFLALRGSPATLAEVAREFRVVYSRMEGPTPTSYTMNHSAGSFIYDAGGQLRIFSRYGSDPQVLQQWLKALLQE